MEPPSGSVYHCVVRRPPGSWAAELNLWLDGSGRPSMERAFSRKHRLPTCRSPAAAAAVADLGMLWRSRTMPERFPPSNVQLNFEVER